MPNLLFLSKRLKSVEKCQYIQSIPISMGCLSHSVIQHRQTGHISHAILANTIINLRISLFSCKAENVLFLLYSCTSLSSRSPFFSLIPYLHVSIPTEQCVQCSARGCQSILKTLRVWGTPLACYAWLPSSLMTPHLLLISALASSG